MIRARLWLVALALAAYAVYRRRRQQQRRLVQIKENSPTHPSFLAAKQAFERNFHLGREMGAQVVCLVDGQPVLDLCGVRDEHSFNDLTIVFSCTKVMESLAVAMLVDQGKLQYEDAICKHWPEFGDVFQDKQTTVQQLMQHQAGLDQVQHLITFDEARRVFASAASLEQWILSSFKQRGRGTTRYHALTRGFFVDVLCSRCDGRRIRDFIEQEIVQRVNARQNTSRPVELYVGCTSPEVQRRTVKCEPASSKLQSAVDCVLAKTGLSLLLREDEDDPDYVHAYEASIMIEFVKGMLFGREYSKVIKSFFLLSDAGQDLHDTANDERLRSLPFSSVLGSSNAHSLARITHELAREGGGVLLSRQGLDSALVTSAHGKVFDEILQLPVLYTKNGWGQNRFREGWTGWDGAGGSLLVWSERHRASFAYVPSKLDVRLHRARGLQVLNRVVDALEEEAAGRAVVLG